MPSFLQSVNCNKNYYEPKQLHQAKHRHHRLLHRHHLRQYLLQL